MKIHQLGLLTVNELQKYLQTNQSIIIPYGVVEQHGFHLPLDTDIRNADVIGLKLAKALDILVAPTIPYCFSGGMLAGTVNIKPTTFSSLVCDIIESLHLQGFRNFIILAGHGGSEVMTHINETLRIFKWMNPRYHDSLILTPLMWEYSPTWVKMFNAQDYHAADAETSLLMYWSPEVVRSKMIIDEEPMFSKMKTDPDAFQVKTKLSSFREEIPTTIQSPEVKVGVMGDPFPASAETGKILDEEMIREMTPAIRKAIEEANLSRSSKL